MLVLLLIGSFLGTNSYVHHVKKHEDTKNDTESIEAEKKDNQKDNQ